MSVSSSLSKFLTLTIVACSSAFPQQPEAPSAPTPNAAPAAAPATLTFPAPNPVNFTADKPTTPELTSGVVGLSAVKLTGFGAGKVSVAGAAAGAAFGVGAEGASGCCGKADEQATMVRVKNLLSDELTDIQS